MEKILDGVGFEWRGDRQLYDELVHLWAITKFADDRLRILLNGPTGSGKELLAKAIHAFAGGEKGKLFSVNCATLHPETATAQLFGAKGGSYTGLTGDRLGYFQHTAAPDSTLLLDEVHELNPQIRTELYRALNEKSFQRFGDSKVDIPFHGHVVSAASRSLDEMIANKSFAQDFYSRLADTGEIRLSSFNERHEDHRRIVIERGFKHWMQKEIAVDSRVVDALLETFFPGNVRDLKTFEKQLASYARMEAHGGAESPIVNMQHFDAVRRHHRFQNLEEHTEVDHTLEGVEKAQIALILEKYEWNKSKAAEVLKIQRSTLDRKIKVYGLYSRKDQAV